MKGKTLKDFEAWLINNPEIGGMKLNYKNEYVNVFNQIQDSMKWGVFVDYYDSVGIKIDVFFTHLAYQSSVCIGEISYSGKWTKYRFKGRKDALEKAWEIREKQLTKQE